MCTVHNFYKNIFSVNKKFPLLNFDILKNIKFFSKLLVSIMILVYRKSIH